MTAVKFYGNRECYCSQFSYEEISFFNTIFKNGWTIRELGISNDYSTMRNFINSRNIVFYKQRYQTCPNIKFQKKKNSKILALKISLIETNFRTCYRLEIARSGGCSNSRQANVGQWNLHVPSLGSNASRTIRGSTTDRLRSPSKPGSQSDVISQPRSSRRKHFALGFALLLTHSFRLSFPATLRSSYFLSFPLFLRSPITSKPEDIFHETLSALVKMGLNIISLV